MQCLTCCTFKTQTTPSDHRNEGWEKADVAEDQPSLVLTKERLSTTEESLSTLQISTAGKHLGKLES